MYMSIKGVGNYCVELLLTWRPLCWIVISTVWAPLVIMANCVSKVNLCAV